METFYEVMRRQGISRRSLLKYCSLTATSLGLGPAFVPQIAHAMETKPRTPVLWLHGLECTCCSESFIRSAHPLAKDVVLSMISLDYDDTLMAAAGHQAEAILEEIMRKYKGNYILAVEGNPPLNQDGMSCIIGGKPFIEQLKHVAKDAKAIISWGSCASWGCVQAAKPNPTQATPVHKVIFDKPIIKVPGCPPIAEVMTGVITYMLTFDRIPELDRQGRPKMFVNGDSHERQHHLGDERRNPSSLPVVNHLVRAGEQLATVAPDLGCLVEVAVAEVQRARHAQHRSLALRGQHRRVGMEVDRQRHGADGHEHAAAYEETREEAVAYRRQRREVQRPGRLVAHPEAAVRARVFFAVHRLGQAAADKAHVVALEPGWAPGAFGPHQRVRRRQVRGRPHVRCRPGLTPPRQHCRRRGRHGF